MSFYINGGEIKYAAIPNVGAGTAAIVAAPGAGNRIIVLGVHMVVTAALETFIWKSATTAIWPATLTAINQVIMASSPYGIMACAANEALNLTTVVANSIAGVVVYRIEP